MSARALVRLLPILCACAVVIVVPQGPILAQEDRDLDLEALRRSALSELATEDAPVEEDAEVEGAAAGDRSLLDFFAMQICLLAVVLVLHTYTGMHIIRRGIIFCDLVLDQLAAFGVIVGIALCIGYGTVGSYLMAMGATLIGCVLLAVLRPKNRLIPQEAVIGIMYGLALIASLLVADRLPTGGTELKNTLVGSMEWVTWPLVAVTAGAYVGLLLFHYVFRKRIIKITDSGGEVPRRVFWDFLFFLSQGIITILIVPVAGVLLAYGFLMIPAAMAVMFTRRWGWGLLVGWAAGMAACVLGLIFSYRTDSPYGPSLLLSMGAFFMVALLLRGLIPARTGGAS